MKAPERVDLSKFLDDVQKAPFLAPKDEDGVPFIEAPIEIIKYYAGAPNQLKAFEEVGYFIFHNVKIYELGKRESIIEKLKKADDDIRKRGQIA